jgi:hypothetical protein
LRRIHLTLEVLALRDQRVIDGDLLLSLLKSLAILMIGRWHIDARFGQKQTVIDALKTWCGDMG